MPENQPNPDLEKRANKPEVKKSDINQPRIDPDVPWNEEHNLDAASQLRWRYDKRSRCYRDSDGELIADEYGQPLG